MSFSQPDPNLYLESPSQRSNSSFSSAQIRSRVKTIEETKKQKEAINNQLNNQIAKNYQKNFQKWRDYDLLTCLLAMIGLALTILDYEYCSAKSMQYTQNLQPPSTDKAYDQIQARLLLSEASLGRVIVLIISCFSVWTLFFRHLKKANWLNQDLPNEIRANLFILGGDLNQIIFTYRKVLKFSFWVEAFSLLMCPVPYFDFIIRINAPSLDRTHKISVYYLFSDFILAFMFIRIFYLMRAFFNYTMFMDVYSKKLCRSFNFTANVRFAYKCFLKKSPGKTIFGTIFMSILIGAYLIRIFELPYAYATGVVQICDFFTGIWFMVITLTTVGYGDVYPSTVFGRTMIMVAAFWGTFLISLMIMSVSMVFNLKDTEQKALHHLLQTRRAACAITAAMRYWLAKKRYLKSPVFDEVMIEDRVELTDIATFKREMLVCLADFMDNKAMIKEFEKHAKEDDVSVALIKNQVLEMADKFDKMQANQAKQGLLLSYLVNQQTSGGQEQEVTEQFESFESLQQQINQAQIKLRQLQEKCQLQFGGSSQQHSETINQVAMELSKEYMQPSNVDQMSYRKSPFWQKEVVKGRGNKERLRLTVMEQVMNGLVNNKKTGGQDGQVGSI